MQYQLGHDGPVLTTAQTIAETAPWWFAGTIGLAGVTIGVILKWITDALSQRNRNRRESQYRFIADKRTAFTNFLAASHAVADVREQMRDHEVRRLQLDAKDSSQAEDDEFNEKLDHLGRAWESSWSDLREAVAMIDLIADKATISACHALASVAHRKHGLRRRWEAEEKFIAEARRELEAVPVKDATAWVPEDFADDEDEEEQEASR
ncbi:hypothetical protein JCM9957A_26970 [Kineosporia succinea]